jgi:16S rRNA (cytosine1402-N4)-methyltransferase
MISVPHQSVLFEEAITALNIKKSGKYVDCTFGRGGHSQGIIRQLGANGELLAFDRDKAAVESDAAVSLSRDSRFHLHHGAFGELKERCLSLGWSGKVDGILLDLGVSSPQLDEAERGFSFMRNGPLDMRMDASTGMTAEEYLATVTQGELERVLREYGEERFAKRIARSIVESRAMSSIRTTKDLADLVSNSVPVKEKHKHPATRTFQAIRIEINQELNQLEQVLEQSLDLLAPGGRLVVISFHSLEDRMVKRFIRDEVGRKFNPGRLPIKEMDIPKGQLVKVGGKIKAGSMELQQNIRARSAVMRVAEKAGGNC